MKHETYKLEIILKRSKKLHWHSSWPQQVPSLEKLLFKWESFPFTGLTLMMKWRLKSRKKELAKRLFFTGNSERRRFGKFPFYEEKKAKKEGAAFPFSILGKRTFGLSCGLHPFYYFFIGWDRGQNLGMIEGVYVWQLFVIIGFV